MTDWRAPVRARAKGRDGAADGFDALVLDAATKQSLACVRSLGRAGLRVALAECFAECDPALAPVAFRSRYSAKNVVLPSFADDPAAFADAVVSFVREHPTRVVIAEMDGSIAAIATRRKALADLGCVLALPSDEALTVANDKDRTLAVAASLGIACPVTARIDAAADIPAVLAEFDFPVVLKPTISWASQSATRLQPVDAIDAAEASALARDYLDNGVPVLVQQLLTGRREGVTLFVVDGDVRAACGHIAHRTTPPLGGASALRESQNAPPDIYEAAVALVMAIGLEGPAEVEFRRDAAGRPLLMEVNARLGGTIENAMRSGVDLPLMIWQWATREPVLKLEGHRNGVRTRWLHGDMRWLWQNFSRAGRPDSVPPLRSVLMFGTEFARSHHYDCLDWHDLRPFATEMRNTAAVARRARH